MQEFLLGSWGPQILAYSQQYPWRVFAAVLVAIPAGFGVREKPVVVRRRYRPI